MNLNLGSFLLAFLTSLGVHSVLVMVIATAGGFGSGQATDGVIDVEIVVAAGSSDTPMLAPDNRTLTRKLPTKHRKLPQPPQRQLEEPHSSGPAASLNMQPEKGTANLVLINAPKPPYPLSARKRGVQGDTLLELKINQEGRVRSVEVLRSSGSPECDFAAQDTILNAWRFAPQENASRDTIWKKQAIIKFRLED